MAQQTSQKTTDHKKIREWVESRGGTPAKVKETGGKGDPGLLRITFPKSKHSEHEDLEPVDWDAFFKKFDEEKLAMVYQEETSSGQTSLFCKLVSRD